jgi:hypothetical protein
MNDEIKTYHCRCQLCKATFITTSRYKRYCDNQICVDNREGIGSDRKAETAARKRIADKSTKPIKLNSIDCFLIGRTPEGRRI